MATQNTQKKENAISEDMAINELLGFYNFHSLTEKTEEDVKDDLSISLIALQKGLLVINSENVPTLTLKDPIKNEDGQVSKDSIEFKTRIFPSDHIKLSKGLNISKDQMEYATKCQALLAQLPTASYLNKLSKFDLKVVQELSAVFM